MKNDLNPESNLVTADLPQISEQLISLAIKACIVTSSTPAVLTKTRRYDEATGNIISEKNGNYPAGSLINGTAENYTFHSMKQFAAFLDGAKMNQALIAAQHTAPTQTTKIMSRNAYHRAGEPADAITRTKDNFYRAANEHGLLILDCDDYRTTKEQFLGAVRKVLPLDSLAYAYTTSSSSYLSVPGKIEGIVKGQRLYIVLKDASHTTEAGENLFKRLWLEGHGWYEAGNAGQYLNRGIIDTAMFKDSCRLDFIAGSNCKAPVIQTRPPAEYNEGEPLDSRALLDDLTRGQLKELEAIQASARDRIEAEAAKKKAIYCDKKARDNLKQQGITEPTPDQLDKAKSNVLKALDSSSLTGDFVITLAKDHKQVTVADLLNDPERYDQAETLDPLENDYNNYSAVGKLFLMEGRPTLHSFAHGGKVYRLFKQSRFIQHAAGSTAETTNDTLALMRLSPLYYDMGEQLVTIRGGHVVPMTEHLLSYELGSIAQYYTEKTKDGKVVTTFIDPPATVVKQILSMSAKTGDGNTQRGLKPLDAVITAPTITPDNHVVYKRGYDARTRLYLSTRDEIAPPPEVITPDLLQAAYKSIMAVIDTFKLNSNLSKSVVLSAFLSAVVRPTIEEGCPIFAFDAPNPGSGKTYLAECLGLLTLGEAPSIIPAIQGDEAEISKTLFAMLLNNDRVIIWDNIMGRFNSAKLASFVTSKQFKGRVLGSSQTLSLPNKASVIFTGNNLQLYGDIVRRCIVARIDTGEENPLNTKRDLTALGGIMPHHYIRKNRQRLAMDCITIVRAYLTSSAHATRGRLTERPLPSFEQWDTVARQPIEYLRVTGIAPELEDIKTIIDENLQNDSKKIELAELLSLLHDWRGEQPFTAKQLYNYAFANYDEDPRNANRDILTGNSSDLRELLNALCLNSRTRAVTSRVISGQLRFRKDTPAGNMSLKIIEQPNNRGSLYQVVTRDQ